MKILRDKWQQEVMDAKGHILVAKGRRIGATKIMAEKAVEYLMTHHNDHPLSQIVCVSISEEQARLVISFATEYAEEKYPKYIGKKGDKPTLNTLNLIVDKNKRILIAKATGNTGKSVRGFEGQILMVDEAPYMPKDLWAAAKPILMTSRGKIWMWGTFNGKEGYFWDRFEEAYINKHPKARFKAWKETTEDVLSKRPISASWTKEQREDALQLLEDEKREMSEAHYAQEYMAQPSDDIKRIFSDRWIEKVCTIESEDQEPILKGRDYYMGVDIARLGGDECAFEVIRMTHTNHLIHTYSETAIKKLTTWTEDKIVDLDKEYDFRKIYIDAGAGSLGVGVFDHLLKHPRTEGKVEAINNRQIAQNRDGTKTQRILKEDLYDNLVALGEREIIKLLKDEKVMLSLRSIQYEHVRKEGQPTKVRIFGRYSHIAEGLIRAAWCSKEKVIKDLLYSFPV